MTCLVFPPFGVSSLQVQHGCHSHVLSDSAAHQITGNLKRGLSEWRIGINVSKLSAMLFAKASRRIPKPRPVQLVREPIQWVDTARYLRVTIDKRLLWSTHIDQVRKKAEQTGSAGNSPKQ